MVTSQDRSPAPEPEAGLCELLGRLWKHLSIRRRAQVHLVFALMLISAFAELVSLAAVLPFLGILSAPDKVLAYSDKFEFVRALGFTSAEEMRLPLTAAFVIAAVVAAAARILLAWVSIRFASSAGSDLSVEVYRRTLYQPYSVHVSRNSSEVISGIIVKISTVVFGVIQPILTLASSAVLLITIVVALLAVDPLVASAAGAGFGLSYLLLARFSRQKLLSNGERIAREQTQVVKALQEGLGGIRDVLLDGTQALYSDIYRRADRPLRAAYGSNAFIYQCPRPIMEAAGMVLIAALAYSLSLRPGGIGTALPVLGALALGAQRLLPALQQMYLSWGFLVGSKASLADSLKLLEQALPAEAFSRDAPAPLNFRESICFDAVSYRYSNDGPWVLDGFNLTIPKGARVGFVGTTGSGKSTALDLLMALLEPTQGRILVDGRSINGDLRRAWQGTIAHVPQSIYLADSTLAENIAFGVAPSQIDMGRLREAARLAQIDDFVQSSPKGYGAFVGERGIRLSGGQRQRIGIARALYKRASVLVFDEATSALDNATEDAVMQAIERLDRDLTILIIAHRLTTVMICDTVVELSGGRVVCQGTYSDLMQRSTNFRRIPTPTARLT